MPGIEAHQAISHINLALRRASVDSSLPKERQGRQPGELENIFNEAESLWRLGARLTLKYGEPKKYITHQLQDIIYYNPTTPSVPVAGPNIPEHTALRLRGQAFGLNPHDEHAGSLPDTGTVILEVVRLNPNDPHGEPLFASPITAIRGVHRYNSLNQNNFAFVDPDDTEQFVYPNDTGISTDAVRILLGVMEKGLEDISS